MKINFFIILCLFSLGLHAETIKSQLHSVDEGKNGDSHLIKIMNGRVVFLSHKNLQLLNQLKSNFHGKSWLEFRVDKKNNLISVKNIPVPAQSLPERDLLQPLFNVPYKPSIVTQVKASNMFKRMRRDYTSKGQCFNRAHVWTYEENQKYKTNLNKVFLFFTRSYIKKYKFKWWFHVTPMTYVGGSRFSNWKMLDRRYTSGPIMPKTWTDIFIKSKRSCPVISKISDYYENQYSQHCYMLPASMYYVVPSDLERLERTGEERTEYEILDVEHAYWDGFGKEL